MTNQFHNAIVLRDPYTYETQRYNLVFGEVCWSVRKRAIHLMASPIVVREILITVLYDQLDQT